MFALLFLSLLLCGGEADFKLSDSKVLLPYYSFNAVNYTLHGSNGACYDWSSSTPEVATITPIYEPDSECSRSAVITAVWQSPHRAVTTIHARVSTTGHIVKCDVIVDNVHRVDIETTTQELYLHNTPESLVAVGYDEFGNTFSSMDGVPFEWRIQGDSYSGAGDGHSVLRFLTWTESEYVTPPGIAKLEQKGLQGHMQLVSGLRTGSAVVGVSLSEAVYSGIKPAQVRLLVMANAQLSPALAYLIPNAQIRLRVRVIQQGSDQEIRMPSSQYHLQVNDSTLATLDPDDGCTVTAKRYGQTQITLLDRNVEEALENLRSVLHTEASSDKLPRRRLPTSLVHIVEPAYLGFSLSKVSPANPDCKTAIIVSTNTTKRQTNSVESGKASRDWIMEVGQLYQFVVDIYDQNSHRIHPTNNLRIDLRIPNDKFEVIELSENGTFAILKPQVHGRLLLEARLDHLLDKNGAVLPVETPVEGSQEVMVYPSVRIQPSTVFLPWPSWFADTEHSDSDDGFQLVGTGGSGQLTWVALSPSIAREAQSSDVVAVTSTGQVSALALGEATVVAYSSAHPQLCGVTKVIVTSPASIRFVAGPAEVVVPDDPSHQVALVNPTVFSQNTADTSGVPDMSVLIVGIAAMDPQGRSMTDCRRLNIRVKPLDSSIVKVLPDRLPPPLIETQNGTINTPFPCVRVLVTGLRVGFTELEATLDLSEQPGLNSQRDDNLASDRTKSSHLLTSRFPVAAYQRIEFLNPVSGKTHVAPGSTRTMLFDHGPRPWPLEPTGYFTRITPYNKGLRQTQSTKDESSSFPKVIREPELWKTPNNDASSVFGGVRTSRSLLAVDRKARPMVFSMRCEELGTYEFVLQIGNRPSSANPVPLVMSSKFTVVCDAPERLRLVLHRPTLSLPAGVPSCPLLNTSVPEPSDVLAVPNTVPALVALSFLNSDGVELDAVDSLTTSVLVLKTTSTGHPEPSDLVQETKPKVQFPSSLSIGLYDQTSPPYFTIKPRSLGVSSGLVTIQVTARSTHHSSRPTGSQLDSSLNIRFSPIPKLLPNRHLRLLHHPKVDVSFSILGGSGYYFLSTTPSTSSSDVSSKVRLTPLTNPVPPSESTDNDIPLKSYRIQSQQVGLTEIHVWDVCFPALNINNAAQMVPVDLTLTVDVVGLSALRLQVADRIPLGGQTTAVLYAVDSRGEVLPHSFTKFLDVRVHQSTNIQDPSKPGPQVLGLPDEGVLQASHWRGVGPDLGLASFDVHGLVLGSTILDASTETYAHDSVLSSTVRSNAIDMQVFASLSLSPCQFNLLVGAEYELRALGGPHPAVIEFTVDEESERHARLEVIRAAKSSVLIRAGRSFGPATIRARAVSLSSTRTNSSELGAELIDSIVSSETSCSINVVALSGIRIGCPLASATENILGVSGSTTTTTTAKHQGDERFLIACRPDDESTRNCGTSPIWVEGIAQSLTHDKSGWSLRDAFPAHNMESNHSTNDLVSPLSIAGVDPPLRFVWQLDPPQPTSVARLKHILEGFNVDPHVMHSSSGMMFIGQAPGRVTVHVTVEATDPSAGQLIGPNGRPVQRLHAQLPIVILPQLGLAAPLIPSPRQLLMSRNSRFHLQPWNDVISNSHVQYEISTFQHNKTVKKVSGFIVSTDGSIQAPAHCPTQDASGECHSLVRLRSLPKERSAAKEAQLTYDSPLAQTMFVDVLVKEPRYLLAVPVPGEYLKAEGLSVGGPYRFAITYHDELGRTFDSVSDDYLHLNVHLHRVDAFDAQLDSSFVFVRGRPSSVNTFAESSTQTTDIPVVATSTFDTSRSILTVRVLPGTNYADSRPTRSTLPTVVRLNTVDSVPGFLPSYLTLVSGGELDVLGSTTSLLVSQWICLPEMKGGGAWSSSNPSIFYVDSRNSILLARQPGKAYLLYSLGKLKESTAANFRGNFSTDRDYSGQQLTYLITVEVSPLASEPQPALQLIHAGSDESSVNTGPVLLPIRSPPVSGASSSVLRLPVRLVNPASTIESSNHPMCSLNVDESRRTLVSMTPLQCHVRMTVAGRSSSAHQSSLVPNWLSLLMLWNQNETLHTIMELDSGSPSLVNLVTARLEPLFPNSPFYSTNSQWQCVLRPTKMWHSYAQLLGLVLEPGTLLSVELRSSDAHESSPALARLDVVPIPGIQVTVPPALTSGIDSTTSISTVYHYWITDPHVLHRRLLVFVPPATVDSFNLPTFTGDRLYARSKVPEILQVLGPPRPITSLTEVSEVLVEYEHSLIVTPNMSPELSSPLRTMLNAWRVLALDQIHHIDNDAAVSAVDDSFVKRNMLWIVDLKAHLGDSSTNTVIDVIVSCRQTGQHTAIPVHIILPAAGDQSIVDIGTNQSRLAPLGFSWIHLFAIILITLLIAVVLHVLLRSTTLISSSSGSSSVSKNLPTPLRSSVTNPQGISPRKLWSQGYSISSPRASMAPSSYSPAQQLFDTGSPAYAVPQQRFGSSGGGVSDAGDLLLEEQRWRRALSGGSPSRLRDTFDSI